MGSQPTKRPFLAIHDFARQCVESVFAVHPPAPALKLPQPGTGPRVAIIGAGLTGVLVAAHCIGNGVDCAIFEAGPREQLGGIWSRPSEHATLELESLLYRFCPAVKQGTDNVYSARQQIVGFVTAVWSRYGLEQRTHFNSRVSSVYQDRLGRWIVHEPSQGRFDAVVAACGACDLPKTVIPTVRDGISPATAFDGPVWHSSDLAGRSCRGKKVVIVGGGAEAVQALEFVASTGGLEAIVLSPTEDWNVPRNPVIAAIVAVGSYVGLDRLLKNGPKSLSNRLFYNELESLTSSSSSNGPIVSDSLVRMVGAGKVTWLHGDVVRFLSKGVTFSRRVKGMAEGGPGIDEKISANVCVLATGYHRPSLGSLTGSPISLSSPPPPSAAPESHWFLQSFLGQRLDLGAFNCTYSSPVGVLGNWHIALYTRMLLLFLLVPSSRPSDAQIRRLVKTSTRLRRSGLLKPLFDAIAYVELVRWLISCVFLSSPSGWRWILFVLFAINKAPLATALTCNPAASLTSSISSASVSASSSPLHSVSDSSRTPSPVLLSTRRSAAWTPPPSASLVGMGSGSNPVTPPSAEAAVVVPRDPRILAKDSRFGSPPSSPPQTSIYTVRPSTKKIKSGTGSGTAKLTAGRGRRVVSTTKSRAGRTAP